MSSGGPTTRVESGPWSLMSFSLRYRVTQTEGSRGGGKKRKTKETTKLGSTLSVFSTLLSYISLEMLVPVTGPSVPESCGHRQLFVLLRK